CKKALLPTQKVAAHAENGRNLRSGMHDGVWRALRLLPPARTTGRDAPETDRCRPWFLPCPNRCRGLHKEHASDACHGGACSFRAPFYTGLRKSVAEAPDLVCYARPAARPRSELLRLQYIDPRSSATANFRLPSRRRP